MSLPGNTLSTILVNGPFKGARNRSEISEVLDWEDGGIAIGDTSQGLEYQAWRCRIVSNEIVINPEFGSDSVIYSSPGTISECSLTFDQAMRPVIAFVEDGVAKFRWYNTNTLAYEVTTLPVGAISPRVALDDKRSLNIDQSDVIVAYINAGDLSYVQQSDDYGIVYVLSSDITGSLIKIGMNDKLRMQFLKTND